MQITRMTHATAAPCSADRPEPAPRRPDSGHRPAGHASSGMLLAQAPRIPPMPVGGPPGPPLGGPGDPLQGSRDRSRLRAGGPVAGVTSVMHGVLLAPGHAFIATSTIPSRISQPGGLLPLLPDLHLRGGPSDCLCVGNKKCLACDGPQWRIRVENGCLGGGGIGSPVAVCIAGRLDRPLPRRHWEAHEALLRRPYLGHAGLGVAIRRSSGAPAQIIERLV